MKMSRVSLLLVFCVPGIFAEGAHELPVITVMAPIVVRNLLETPAAESASLEIATSSVDADQILQQNAVTLTDAIQYAPGVHIETRGRKYKSLTSFRGQIYPYPTYSLDGIWQREFNELAYVLPASQIGQVDLLRSSGALFSGLGDITGVIQVKPRRYEQKTTAVEGEVGTYNSTRIGVVQGDTNSNSWYTAGANTMQTDGPDGRNAAEHAYSVYGFGGAQVHERLMLEGQFFAIEAARELMTPDADGPALDSLKTREEEYDPISTVHIGGKAIWTQSSSATLEIAAGYTERSYHYIRRGSKPTTADEDDYEYCLQAIQALELSDVNTLRFGAAYNHWVAPEGKRAYAGYRQDVETYALIMADEHQFDELTLDAGLRVQRDYYNEFSGASFNIYGNNRDFKTVKNEWGDPLLTATLGAKYNVSETLSLYSHIAGGERGAQPGAIKADDSDLRTESRVMVDAGIQLQASDLGVLKVGGFYVSRKDAVVKTDQSALDPSGDVYYFSDNQDITQYGLELDAKTVPVANVASFFFNLTLMESRLTPPDSSSQDYAEIPDLITSGGVMLNAGRWDAMLAAKYVSSYENSRFVQSKESVDLGDYLDLNATAGYTFGSKYNTRVYLAVSNLLDDDYSTVAGWSDDGIAVYIGARHEF